MPPIYWDGVELSEDRQRLIANAMGPFNETCCHCGGSIIEIKGIILSSNEESITLLTWCGTCGRSERLSQDFPVGWYQRLIKRI
jgi:hypothetical protein